MKASSEVFNLSSSFVSIAATNNTNKIRKLKEIHANETVCLRSQKNGPGTYLTYSKTARIAGTFNLKGIDQSNTELVGGYAN
jgi:hypothetical protein